MSRGQQLLEAINAYHNTENRAVNLAVGLTDWIEATDYDPQQVRAIVTQVRLNAGLLAQAVAGSLDPVALATTEAPGDPQGDHAAQGSDGDLGPAAPDPPMRPMVIPGWQLP